MSKQITKNNENLFVDVRQMIEDAKHAFSQTVNAGLTILYWNIGNRINEEVLDNKRAEYGEKILPTLSAKLTEEYGNGYSKLVSSQLVNILTKNFGMIRTIRLKKHIQTLLD